MINLNKVSYEVGGRQVLSDVSFGINAGDRIGLVGPNGVGKTTLLHLINRDIIPTSGQITYDQTEIGMLPQDLNGWLDHTIEGFVASVTGVEKASDNFDILTFIHIKLFLYHCLAVLQVLQFVHSKTLHFSHLLFVHKTIFHFLTIFLTKK